MAAHPPQAYCDGVGDGGGGGGKVSAKIIFVHLVVHFFHLHNVIIKASISQTGTSADLK